MLTLVAFIVALGLLIAVHEYGHYRVAVAAFLERRIRFDQIHSVNLATLEAVAASKPGSLEDLLGLDTRSREAAGRAIAGLG